MGALKVKDKQLLFDPERCIGCGVCSHKCKHGACNLIHRDGEQDIPKDPREQGMRFLKERGINPNEAFRKNFIM